MAFHRIALESGRHSFVFILMCVLFLIGIFCLSSGEADQGQDSRRTIKALEETARAQIRQAKVLESMVKEIRMWRAECQN